MDCSFIFRGTRIMDNTVRYKAARDGYHSGYSQADKNFSRGPITGTPFVSGNTGWCEQCHAVVTVVCGDTTDLCLRVCARSQQTRHFDSLPGSGRGPADLMVLVTCTSFMLNVH